MFRNLKKWDNKNDEREVKFLVGKLGTLVGQFFPLVRHMPHQLNN